jgi:hypothetical protein
MSVKPKVFISYSSLDRDIILKLESDLKAAQIDVWRDEWEMLSGDDIKKKIFKDGIPACDLFFAYLTANSLSSKWCRLELNAAFIQQQELKGVFVALFVDSEKTRKKLKSKIRSIVTPVLNAKEYNRALAQLIYRTWNSLQRSGKLVAREGRIQAGVNMYRLSEFSRKSILKRVKKELILAGPNLRGWLSDAESMRGVASLIQKKSNVRVKFLLSTYLILSKLDEEGEKHLRQSVRDLDAFRNKFSIKNRSKVEFRFHPALATLSAVFIDPDAENGAVFFTPRWGIDHHPQKRLTCLIERRDNPDLFAALHDSILILSQPTLKGLDEMLSEMKEN